MGPQFREARDEMGDGLNFCFLRAGKNFRGKAFQACKAQAKRCYHGLHFGCQHSEKILFDPLEVTMSQTKPLKGVSSVVVLQKSETGFHPETIDVDPEISHSTSRKYRKREKMLTRVMKAQNAATTEYLARHEASAAKKKNGWVKDFGKNTRKSVKSGLKILKIKLF